MALITSVKPAAAVTTSEAANHMAMRERDTSRMLPR
jgi:hypothetical protein